MTSTPQGSALPRHLVSVLMAALFGITLALNPIAPPKAHAAVTAVVRMSALQVAASQVGIPYKWGGSSPRTGFDCSGLTMYSYAQVGKQIPRTAQEQYNASIHITGHNARPGDLVFFYTGRTIYHVGVYAGTYHKIPYMWHSPHTGERVEFVKLRSAPTLFGRVR